MIVQKALDEFIMGICHKKKTSYKLKIFHGVLLNRRLRKQKTFVITKA